MSLAPGAHLGPYQIQAVIGHGGMGEVYRARDTKLGRDLALKVLPDQFAADPQRLKRFEQEARLASSLNHPNIVTIYDIGLAGGIHYIAMELVQGQTLRTLCEAGPIPLSRAIDIAVQAADGLAKAHAAGIVHRDFKPENVMVTTDGFAKILDFGLGKQTAVFGSDQSGVETIEVAATRAGTILGTVHYMSPEQAAGRDVDFRSDQFAFGVVLYEMVTGRVAFARPTAVQTLSAIIAEEPRPVADLNRRVPERLQEIILRCLTKRPAERYASTLDLARDLRNVSRQQGSSIVVEPPAVRRRWIPSRRTAAAALLVALGMTAAVFAFSHSDALTRWAGGPREPIPADKNVAVLPFRAVDGTADLQASADGLSVVLSSRLARLTAVEAMQVVPAAMVFAGQSDDAAGVRKDLGATLMLRGSVEQVGNTMNVTSVLIDTATTRELRTQMVTAPVSDPALLQDRLLEAVLGMLDMSFDAAERQAIVPRDTAVGAAGALYLQGRGYLQYYEKSENIDRAIDAFDAALKLDSRYARAFAGRGEAHWRKSEIGEPQRWIDAAGADCAQALVLDPGLSVAHACLGRIQNGTGRYEEAALNFERALESDPTDDDAYAGLALAKERLGRIEEAENTYRRAVALRPHYWVNHNRFGHFYYTRGRYADAVRMFAQVVALAPDSFRGYSNLGGANLALGQYEGAITALRRSLEIRPDAPSYSNLGTAYFNLRRFGEATGAFEHAVQMEGANYEVWGNLADAQYFVPDRSAATTSYRRAIDLAEQDLKVNPRNPALLINLANYYAMVGRRADAFELLDRALAIAPRDGFVQFRAAVALNQLGQTDRALDALERAHAAGFSTIVIRDTENLSNLFGYPRFYNLIRGQ